MVSAATMPTVSVSSPRSPRLKLTPASPDNAGPAMARLGKSIALSVEMLATVGETVGDENPEIRGDMLSACRESRAVSGALEKLCESLSRGPRGMSNAVLLHAPTPPPAPAPSGPGLPPEADLEALLRTLRRLLVSVTQILLLADNVVVKQLLTLSKEKGPAKDLNTMSTMHHFTEFVKAFCDFGSEMNSTVRIATGKINWGGGGHCVGATALPQALKFGSSVPLQYPTVNVIKLFLRHCCCGVKS